MSFPRYPEYKDSGVEWMGDVPASWRVLKFRFVFRESSEKIENEVVGSMLSVSGYRGIEIKEYDDENRRRTDEDLIGYRIVRVGQLVVNTMWLNYAGLGVSSYEGHVSPAYRSYFIDKVLTGRFAHHLMRSAVYVSAYTQLVTGVRPNSLQMSREDLMSFPVLVPPLADQVAIATFLDCETAKIDSLVTEQQQLIELLKEKRQAVISHAVTKGLNPNSSMRPTGIEWLGEVPAHWTVLPLKRLVAEDTSISYGIVQPGEPLETGVPFVQTTNMSTGDFDLSSLQKTTIEIASMYPRSQLSGGEVILGIRASIGAAHVVPKALAGTNLSRGVARIVPGPQVTSRYLVAYFGTNAVSWYWEISKQGSTFNEVSIATVRDLSVCVPPTDEQAAITEYVDIELRRFDGLIAEAQRAIDLLQERRAALISAAVTGKIDVRAIADRAAA